jgi:hypothetical protein
MRRQASWPILSAVALTALGVGGLLYGNKVERKHLRLRGITIDVPDLPKAFDG